MPRLIRIQTAAFDLGAEVAALTQGRTDLGAVVTFTGYVRDFNERPDVQALTLEHYPGMTEGVLEQLAADAEQRWSLTASSIIHRVGRLQPGDPIVLVVVASAHRQAAFAACNYVMDALKTRAPFWKKEHTASGDYWVSARHSDTEALARWQTGKSGPQT